MTMILCLLSQTLSLYLHPILFSLHLILFQAHLLSLKIHQFLHLCLVHLALHPLCSLLGLLHELQLGNVILIGSKSPTLLDLDHLNGLRTTEPTPPVESDSESDSSGSEYAASQAVALVAKSLKKELSAEEVIEYAFATSTVEPKSMKEAKERDDWPLWNEAALKEYSQMLAHNVITCVVSFNLRLFSHHVMCL